MDGMDDTLEKRRVQKGESSVVIGSELDTSLENVDSNENKVELASFQSDSHSLKFDLSGVTQADRGAGNGSANGNKGRIGGLSPFLGPLDEEPTFDNSLTFLSPVRKDDTQRIVNDLEAQLVDETDSQLIGYGLGSVKVVLDTQRIDSQRSGRYEDTQKIHDTQVIGHQISDTQRIRGVEKIADTQRIMDTQKIAETQRIADTQRIALDPLGKDDTQVIGLLPLPLSESSPNKVDVSKTHVSLTRANFVDPNTSTPGVNSSPSRIDIGALPTPAKASLSVLQIPNTAERTMQQPLDNGATQSLAQVRNTQEDLIDNTFHMDEIKEPKVQPVYSSSQKNVSEEICTDDEKDVNERVVDISSLPKFSQGGEKKKKKKNNMKRVGEEESDEDDNELSDVDGEEEGVLVNKKRKLTVPESQSTQTQSSSQSKSQINVLREELGYTLPPDSIIHEDSVWAEYKFKMYPGKIHEDHGEYLSIEFGDGFSNVKNQDLYMLDIRIGDKVRLKNGVVQYIVTGLERRVPLGVKGDSQIPSICCVRDYNYAYVRRISKNKIFDEKCVFLGDIYMEIEDWVEHQQRYKIGEVRVGEEKEVKVASGSTPQRRIPTRAGSNTASVNNGTNGIFEYGADKKKKHIERVLSRQSSTLYLKSSALLPPVSPSKKLDLNTNLHELGIFSDSIFCLTNTEVDDKRDEISKLIESHGGIILDQGLQELLTYEETTSGLRLRSETGILKNFRFFAVISNNFCRSAKYLQALAMGWPILSDLFIYDAINLQSLELWYHYLLPSGQLQRLQCIKLYDVYQFRFNLKLGYSLIDQLHNNCQVLSKYNIVIISGNKANAKNLETCEFIFHALGAKQLTYITQFDQIYKIEEDLERLTLVYDNRIGNNLGNNGSNNGFSANTLTSSAVAPKRKRNRARTGGSRVRRNQSFFQIRTIDWEWVVQSVINGYALEPTALVDICL